MTEGECRATLSLALVPFSAIFEAFEEIPGGSQQEEDDAEAKPDLPWPLSITLHAAMREAQRG